MSSLSRSRGAFGRGVSFGLLVVANVLLMASTSAPSPIYPLYLQRWGFSVTVLTVVFAVYVAGLVGALLTVGSLSDHVGRRPVLVAALLVAAAGTAIFWVAGGVVSLVLARIVQGVATGMATGALAAGLVEFSPADRPHRGPTMTAVGTSFGLAVGGGVTGWLVQVSSRPDAMIFPVLTVLFVVLAGLVVAIPEPVVRRPGALAALRPRVGVPREARPEFFAAVPAIVAGWSVTGLFLALAPSLVHDVLNVRYSAAGGLSIAVLFVANSVGGLWAARLAARAATVLGAVLLTLGAVGLAASLLSGSAAVFLGGSVIAGLGVGLTFNGTLRSISAATTAATRSEVFSAAYVVSYAALSLPSLAAGLAAPSWGLETTTYLYIAFVGVLSASATLHAARRRVPRAAVPRLAGAACLAEDRH
ncbi:MFS transporter [Amycolatopsis sp. FDAARGOS 1241]|uniref:MFS transporter n=1 Tax=Amycolatopsis sp. FDAARGOS 1241 TaxID=2778070 RepID=UPI00194E707A|nr:MFS transporter [Amycolatopsis sp. FDAARGOS 1241]QRP50247.1 MFS transporter [Amycolatopsis sp. FDAARGOS 1241]